MDDLISRKRAIAVADFSDCVGLSVDDVKKVTDEVVKGLKRLPSAQPERYWIDSEGNISALPSAQPKISCDGCRYVGTYDTDFPCSGCIRREKDYYEQER